MSGAMWNCCCLGTSSVYTIHPCTSLQCHFIQSHIDRVYVCLAFSLWSVCLFWGCLCGTQCWQMRRTSDSPASRLFSVHSLGCLFGAQCSKTRHMLDSLASCLFSVHSWGCLYCTQCWKTRCISGSLASCLFSVHSWGCLYCTQYLRWRRISSSPTWYPCCSCWTKSWMTRRTTWCPTMPSGRWLLVPVYVQVWTFDAAKCMTPFTGHVAFNNSVMRIWWNPFNIARQLGLSELHLFKCTLL